MLDVASQLGFERFGVMGASGGGPYALACAHEIANQLLFAALMGSWAPVHGTHLWQQMAPIDRFFARLSARAPLAFRAPFSLVMLAATHFSPQAFFWVLGFSMCGADRDLVAEADIAAFYALDQQEAFRQGVRGPADDAILLYQDWGFEVKYIEVPVRLYHGEEDRFAPVAFAEYLHEQLPHSTLHRYPGQGHLFLYRLFDEIFEPLSEIE